MKSFWSGLNQYVVTTFQSMVLFSWRKLMNVLRSSITTILQHRTDGLFFRHDITFKEVSGESEKITKEMTAPWEETTLPTILARYQQKDIFNVDEFGLFYEALPSKSLHFQGKRCSGGKHSKVRLTGMAASNALGEKIPMFVIGKSASPTCFKHVRNLPCRYWSQKKA